MSNTFIVSKPKHGAETVRFEDGRLLYFDQGEPTLGVYQEQMFLQSDVHNENNPPLNYSSVSLPAEERIIRLLRLVYGDWAEDAWRLKCQMAGRPELGWYSEGNAHTGVSSYILHTLVSPEFPANPQPDFPYRAVVEQVKTELALRQAQEKPQGQGATWTGIDLNGWAKALGPRKNTDFSVAAHFNAGSVVLVQGDLSHGGYNPGGVKTWSVENPAFPVLPFWVNLDLLKRVLAFHTSSGVFGQFTAAPSLQGASRRRAGLALQSPGRFSFLLPMDPHYWVHEEEKNYLKGAKQ